MKRIMDGNEACSYVSYYFTELAGIYPITPSSPMGEHIDIWASKGKKNFFNQKVKVVEMQSEAGAAALVHGALLNGTLSTTYTASQGLLLMLPNMYKIAGEHLPAVFNVASRSISTHALSIFGDHQDIYAVKGTGFAILAASSVQEVMDLTSVAYLSALKSSVPFINFFDGFRTSHELQKIDVIDMDKVKELIDKKALIKFKEKALSKNNITVGTNQNDDIYFQIMESKNIIYDKVFDIVKDYMKEISKITKKDYKPFNYYGKEGATKLIVAMGSVNETIKEVIKVREDSALLEVHLFRPFSIKNFISEIPKSIKKIAVLDRSKDHVSRDALYLDVLSAVHEAGLDVEVCGGRYGLSSKDVTPADINAVYEFLNNITRTEFTIGINDDLTRLSLEKIPINIENNHKEILIYGFGSDGMVSASKDIINIIGENSLMFTQAYFEYDSKKSGGLTRSHLRYSSNEIHSTYYVNKPSLVVCSKDQYLEKYNMLKNIKEDGIFLINTIYNEKEINDHLLDETKKIIKERNIKVYYLNAFKIAFDYKLNNKINKIMEYNILKVLNIFNDDFILEKLFLKIKESLRNDTKELIEANIKAVKASSIALKELNNDNLTITGKSLSNNLFEVLSGKRGDNLSTGDLYQFVSGKFIGGLSKLEKRFIAEQTPLYNKEHCITCNQCAFVCPHGVIRPFLLSEDEYEKAPLIIKERCIDALIPNQKYYFTIGVSYKDCTGCGLCANTCPGKKGVKALTMTPIEMATSADFCEINDYLFANITEKNIANKYTIKNSQFISPNFAFSGACAGCGETPYLRLLSQVYKDTLVIANATGCSSIYGASVPGTPYDIPWASSLFEDAAEFGLGLKVADSVNKEKIINIIKNNLDKVKNKVVFENYLNKIDIISAKELLKNINDIPELISEKDNIMPKDYWIIGGDGWAYDIGYGGLDHVLSTNTNINILVLDTEVYSNTGGQSSKATNFGAIAKFASSGKRLAKKDLAKMALAYPHVYVASISMGANMMQTLKALKEAGEYDGPSIVIAYAPCIEHKIIKGMSETINQQKLATASGYFPIFRYNPLNQVFSLDSKADFNLYEDFLKSESRYKNLEKIDENYDTIFKENMNNAMERYKYLESLVNKNE